MNSKIKQLMELAMVPDGKEGIAGSHLDPEKFAELIIAECINDPMVYLLRSIVDNRDGEYWQTDGWTNNLDIAKQWRDGTTGRGQQRDIMNIHFLKRITSV